MKQFFANNIANMFYLLGSIFFVIGTLYNMVKK